ncbi:hypothetical protein J2I47_09710 [Fibrella sp. HMF5335]|uniref:YD repeat-containing protein n=1 Tax=Fibrella rubiginis TaxID=2817060 RepID=A0A939K4K7_9BACT|nr:hypothetical protein [Fibrella rubiginis]MBO0936818.1 hypothetical protein [Fibrella rubiginis]
MKHLSLLGWLSLVFVLSTALTCTDHRDQPAPRFRLKTITYNRPGESNVPYVLTYDDNNRLISFFADGNVGFMNSYRPSQHRFKDNRIDQVVMFDNRLRYYYVLYSYDSQGRTTKLSVYQTDNGNGYANLLVLTEEFTYQGSSIFPTSRLATKNRYGTIVVEASKTETYVFNGGNATSIDGVPYTYDSNPNPYRGLFGFTSYFYSSLDATGVVGLNRPFNISEPFSDSSVKVFNQNNCTTDAQLTYNSDGLVTKIVYKDGKSEVFTYESY